MNRLPCTSPPSKMPLALNGERSPKSVHHVNGAENRTSHLPHYNLRHNVLRSCSLACRVVMPSNATSIRQSAKGPTTNLYPPPPHYQHHGYFDLVSRRAPPRSQETRRARRALSPLPPMRGRERPLLCMRQPQLVLPRPSLLLLRRAHPGTRARLSLARPQIHTRPLLCSCHLPPCTPLDRPLPRRCCAMSSSLRRSIRIFCHRWTLPALLTVLRPSTGAISAILIGTLTLLVSTGSTLTWRHTTRGDLHPPPVPTAFQTPFLRGLMEPSSTAQGHLLQRGITDGFERQSRFLPSDSPSSCTRSHSCTSVFWKSLYLFGFRFSSAGVIGPSGGFWCGCIACLACKLRRMA